MPMTPFRLDLELRSPLAGGELPTLDAVLLGELVRLNPDKDPGRDPDAARNALGMLKWRDNTPHAIPHASALMFREKITAGAIGKVMRVPREVDEIAPRNLGVPPGKRKMPTGKKDTSSLLNHIPCGLLRGAHFIGVGDIDEIKRILAHWQGIGAQWRNGWGALADQIRPPYKKWRIRPVRENPETWGMLDGEKNPVRPLPRELFLAMDGNPIAETVHARACPPYWSPQNKPTQVVLPGAEIRAKQQSRKADAELVDFLFDRFARFMLPYPDPRTGEGKKIRGAVDKYRAGAKLTPDEKAGIVRSALKDSHPLRDSGKNTQRLVGAVLLATPSLTRLAANAQPRKSSDRDDSFPPILPTSDVNQLLAEALEEKSREFVLIEFSQEGGALLENIRFSYGDSNTIALNSVLGMPKGKIALKSRTGTVDRSKIRRIAALEENFCLLPREDWKWKNPLAVDPDLANEPKIAELARLKFSMTLAEKRILRAIRKAAKKGAKKS